MIERLDAKTIVYSDKMEMVLRLVSKINEIIDAVNRMEEQISRMQVLE